MISILDDSGSSDLSSAFMVSINETFDWRMDEGNYCQILFLASKSKHKVLADTVLHFNQLVNLLNDTRQHKDPHTELLCSVKSLVDFLFIDSFTFLQIILSKGHYLDFTVQEIELSMSVISDCTYQKDSFLNSSSV